MTLAGEDGCFSGDGTMTGGVTQDCGSGCLSGDGAVIGGLTHAGSGSEGSIGSRGTNIVSSGGRGTFIGEGGGETVRGTSHSGG